MKMTKNDAENQTAVNGMTEAEMKLARACGKCPLCNYGRRKPESIAGRVMNWHGKYCPAWTAYEKLEKAEGCSCPPRG